MRSCKKRQNKFSRVTLSRWFHCHKIDNIVMYCRHVSVCVCVNHSYFNFCSIIEWINKKIRWHKAFGWQQRCLCLSAIHNWKQIFTKVNTVLSVSLDDILYSRQVLDIQNKSVKSTKPQKCVHDQILQLIKPHNLNP